MTMQPETRFKIKVLDRLRDLPVSWWEKIQQVSIRNTPDILGCVAGQFVALELKTKRGIVNQGQRYKLQKIRNAAGVALVVTPDNLETVITTIKGLYESTSDPTGQQPDGDESWGIPWEGER